MHSKKIFRNCPILNCTKKDKEEPDMLSKKTPLTLPRRPS